ncbi:MAG TPA: neuraminidase-like domain-containing protein, partial [Polyangiaceae bacterium]|nr:neuraminidase-like domain-containing protein [Polyangiaceae bacterium]
FFKKQKASHPLNLKTRRPDLWELPLSCDNTNTLVASLDIANEVLENYIGRSIAEKNGTKLELHPRGPVEALVYKDTLAQSARSFGQPFVLPLARLNGYLAHFKRDRGDVARALAVPRAVLTRAELDLSEFEFHSIVHAKLEPAYLSGLYDHAFEVRGAGAPGGDDADATDKLVRVDVVEFLRATGLARDDFGAIAESHFVQLGSGSPKIVSAKSSPASVQADTERVKGLSYEALDRMHRFTRLWRHLEWLPGELDLALRTLKATELNATSLEQLADVRRAKQRLHTSVEETCALFGAIPAHPVDPDGTSLMDRLFNTDPPHASGRALPDPEHPFLHPALRVEGSHNRPDPALPRLLAGLRISDDDLLALLTTYLSGALGIDPDNADEDKRRFALSSPHLSLLYRHARLAERLRLSIPELFQLLSFVPRPAGQSRAVNDLAELTALLDLHAWWRKTGFSLDDVAVITGAEPSDPRLYPSARGVVIALLGASDASSPLVFADTVFAGALGITEELSRSLIQKLAALGRLELVADGADGAGGVYRLAADFDPSAPLPSASELGLSEADAGGVLAGFHPARVLPSRLSSVLQMSAEKVAALIEMTGQSLLAPGIALALRVPVPAAGVSDPAPEAKPLVDLVAALLPLAVLFKASSFDADAVRFVNVTRAAFGLEKLPAIDVAAVRAVAVYARFAPPVTNVVFEGDATPPNPADLRAALGHFDAKAGFGPKVHDELARVLGTKRRALRSILAHVELTAPAALAFEQLAAATALAQHLGVGGAALADTVARPGNSTDLKERATAEYDALERAADALLGAFRSRYEDDDERAKQLEPHENQLRSLRRDALTDYLIHVYKPAFQDQRAIYEYFLVDVELAGVARTSRVVSA